MENGQQDGPAITIRRRRHRVRSVQATCPDSAARTVGAPARTATGRTHRQASGGRCQEPDTGARRRRARRDRPAHGGRHLPGRGHSRRPPREAVAGPERACRSALTLARIPDVPGDRIREERCCSCCPPTTRKRASHPPSEPAGGSSRGEDILVVDDSSTDRTPGGRARARRPLRAAACEPRHRRRRRRRASLLALRAGYEVAVQVDADGQHDPLDDRRSSSRCRCRALRHGDRRPAASRPRDSARRGRRTGSRLPSAADSA